mmetsp:Transcript_18865/g.21616  ORF Transcript_18865/g.21616 Transcript_18865/m.21616 type:complete len:213 (-) Transcript_18865:25-663(-)|eukprot:CAMPEP_0194134256 /NCGR_PEP_ID=MMETSP0152-20130528/4339_1 /TAXON_ID=1049557 /ORGANISM="Thalassiothrix antarctica, Strain L6-D1" /LENGTH=212 /DNA_ID=CAMNT_0038829897 /DNA_START=147 /DNA_END=785 /DNA_ORIENTATION=+
MTVQMSSAWIGRRVLGSFQKKRGFSSLLDHRLVWTSRNQQTWSRYISSPHKNINASQKSLCRNFSKGTSSTREGAKTVEKASKQINKSTFLQRFLGPKEMPEKGTFQWYREMCLLCTVFAITGSSTMFLVRPAMSQGLGLKGSMRDGPWSYRIGSLVIMTPLYAALLVTVGTTFGRHFYFRHFAVKMFSRFGIPPEMMDSTFHQTAKKFRKW